MDCDGSFGGYSRNDGVGCAKCDPGSVFVKNITEKSIANRSAVQHCVPCPDGARMCSATAIGMERGCLVRKKCGAKELCTVFLPEFDANMNVTNQLCTMYRVTVIEA